MGFEGLERRRMMTAVIEAGETDSVDRDDDLIDTLLNVEVVT